MAITHGPRAERPREKLASRGAAALSDTELLAIFLRTDMRGLRELFSGTIGEDKKHLGIGIVVADPASSGLRPI